MKFKTLEDLIDFEKGIEWKNEKEVNINDYSFTRTARSQYNRLKNRKYLGIAGDQVVSAVSGKFRAISVADVADACEKYFGSDYDEKSFKQGIVRIYSKGIEDSNGEVSPMVVYPPNFGTMAVKIGLYHVAFVCSNGLMMVDNIISQRIIHRLSSNGIERSIKKVSDNLGFVLDKIDYARSKEISEGLQLAMIVQGLGKKDNLVKMALKNYPEESTLWDTIQSVTSIATHKTKAGFEYAKKAGDYLFVEGLSPEKVIDATNYVFKKEKSGAIKFDNSRGLYELAVQELIA
jgi:hypothetical protein